MGYRSFHEHGNKKSNIQEVQEGVFQSENGEGGRKKNTDKDTRRGLRGDGKSTTPQQSYEELLD